MKELIENLIREFSDKEYAHSYMESHASSRIATQIKVLREQRGLTQAQLATLSGMMQERISALENVDYDAWTAKTLRKLARAFDAHLHIAFVPFSEGIRDVANFDREHLMVESRVPDLDVFSRQMSWDGILEWEWEVDEKSLQKSGTPILSGPIDPNEFQDWQNLEKRRAA